MPVFLLLCLVSVCMNFDCRFKLDELIVRKKNVKLRSNKVKKASKRGPIGPIWRVQGKNHGLASTILCVLCYKFVFKGLDFCFKIISPSPFWTSLRTKTLSETSLERLKEGEIRSSGSYRAIASRRIERFSLWHLNKHFLILFTFNFSLVRFKL